VIKGTNSGDVRNLRYNNIILWTDFARPIEIGAETRADVMSDIQLKDIDIIHSCQAIRRWLSIMVTEQCV